LGLGLPLLRPTLLLLGLVAGQGAVSFLGLAFGLVVHSCSFPSTALWGQRLLVRGLLHVPDGDAPVSPGALHLGEVHTQLLGLLLGCLRGVWLLTSLLLASSGLLGRLPCGLLPLLGRLAGCVLGLLGCPACGFLGLARNLPGLIGGLSRYLLGLARNLSYLIGDSAQGTSAPLLATPGEPAYGFLGLARNLPGLIGGLSRHLLGLIGGLASGLLSLLGCSSGSFLGLARNLPGLIGSLAGGILGLSGDLSGGVLGLLGCPACGLLDLLLGLLGGLLHLVLYPNILGRLIHRALELYVRVDHLLDLGLRILWELLRKLLQLGAVILHLALEAAYRLPVEVLGVLRRLLNVLLLKVRYFGHLVSFFLVGSRFR
jgi:hypothetical protein